MRRIPGRRRPADGELWRALGAVPSAESDEWSVYNFDHTRFIQGVKSSVFVNAPAGFYYNGDPGFPSDTGINKQWWHFTPRVGLAWDVKGDGRTSIRASYSYGYAFNSGIWREDTSGSNPWGGRTTITNPPGGLDGPWNGFPGGNPFPYTVDKNVKFTPYGLFLTTRYDLKTPNLFVESEHSETDRTRVARFGQLHRNTDDAYLDVESDQSGDLPRPRSVHARWSSISNVFRDHQYRPAPHPESGAATGWTVHRSNGGIRRRRHADLSRHAALSRAPRESSPSPATTRCRIASVLTPTSTRTVRRPMKPTQIPMIGILISGNCDSDRRQLFNLTALAETPQFSNTKLRMLATGWRLSGIYRISSGQPLSLLAGTDRALTGVTSPTARSDTGQRIWRQVCRLL